MFTLKCSPMGKYFKGVYKMCNNTYLKRDRYPVVITIRHTDYIHIFLIYWQI